MADRTATLAIKVVTDAKGAAAGLNQARTETSKFQRGLAAASKASALALAGVGAAAIKMGKAAAEDAQSQAMLVQTMKNTIGASKGQVEGMERWISKASAATGVADDQLRPAMETLLRATGNYADAQRDSALALDIAAASGKDVTVVAKALAKGYGGSVGALSKLVPGLSKAALKSKDMDRITAQLAKRTKGAAAASANTAAGQMKRFALSIEEAQEAIGAALLPAINAVTPLLVKLGTWAQNNTTAFLIVGGAIAGVAVAVLAVSTAVKVANAAMVAWAAATKIAAAVQWAWNAAMAANPIGAIVALVALFIAGLVLLFKKNERFRRAVLAAWAAIRAAVAAVVAWIGPKLAALWRGIQVGAEALGRAIKAVWTGVRTAVAAVVTWVKGKWEGLWDALKRTARTVGDALAAPFDAVTSAVNAVIEAVKSVISWLGKLKFPSPPKWLSKVVPGSFLAPAPAVAPTALGATARASSAPTIQIVVQGAVDPESTARQIRRILAGHDRRVGLRPA